MLTGGMVLFVVIILLVLLAIGVGAETALTGTLSKLLFEITNPEEKMAPKVSF
jgi:hypothetical protein